MRSFSAFKGNNRARVLACLVIGTSFVTVATVYADQIEQSGAYDSGEFNTSNPNPYNVIPFDHSLGSLRDVHVEIDGQFDARIGLIFDNKNYNVGVGLNFLRPPDVLPFFEFEGDGAVFTYQGKSPPNPIPEFYPVFPWAPLVLPSAQLHTSFSFSRARETAGLPSGVIHAFTVSFDRETLPGFGNIPVNTGIAVPTGVTGGTINYSDLLLLRNDLFPVATEVFGRTRGPAQGQFSGVITIIYDYAPVPPPIPDTDEDGVADPDDNCPINANADQTDTDVDGVGDACDNCIIVANPEQTDSNGDGIGDACEVQPLSCDLDRDGDVDRNDIGVITGLRGTTSPPSDALADFDDNGIIDVIDARSCVRQCTLPRCAVQ